MAGSSVFMWHRAHCSSFLRAAGLPVARLLALAFIFVLTSAEAVIRDGGTDPANLGKGEWLYYMSSATNRLGGNVAAVTNENSLMLYLKSQDIRYVIVKAATSDQLFYGSYDFPQFTSNLVASAHANGLWIFGYNRSYGEDIAAEIAISDYVFQQGADGFIWDAEAEWESHQAWIGTNGPALAWQLCSTVRSNWPTKFLAHSPFAIISLHDSFPYKEFGYWCDAVMPQIYHFSTAGLKRSTSAAITWTDVNWADWQGSLTGQVSEIDGQMIYWTNAIKPVVPIQDVYGPLYSSPTPDKDVMEFIDFLEADPNCAAPGGYNGANFFRADLHGDAQWAAIRSGTPGDFPGQVKNLVFDDAAARIQGAWTPVQTFTFTPRTPTFIGDGSGTDTNSFGTNYFVCGQGWGSNYVEFIPEIRVSGAYNLYQWHPLVLNASASVPFVVAYPNGSTATVYANQRTNAGQWTALGRFYFHAGTATAIRITDGIAEPTGVAIADGLKLVLASPDQVLGYGDNLLEQTAVPPFTTNILAVAAGAWHSLALSDDGSVRAWGENGLRQCDVPPALDDAVAIAAGGYHNLALRANGAVVAWGGNDYGQTAVPPDLGSAQAIAAGTWHSLALRADGTIVAWGDNAKGQCSVPSTVVAPVAIAAGGNHSLALQADGTVVAWGDNTDAQGSYVGQSVVPWNVSNVVAIAAGDYHSLAVRADGTVAAWGDNSQGQCEVPAGLSNVIAVAAGTAHSLALRADGTVVAWGNNWNGQGDVPATYYDVVGLAAGGYHSLLLAGNLPPPRPLQPTWNDGRFNFLLRTVLRRNYVWEYKDSLSGTDWTHLATIAGDGTLHRLVDAEATPVQRFYRIRAVEP